MNKVDKRYKYYMVVDVETAGGFGNPAVYDIGISIVNRTGKAFVSESFLTKEIFLDRKLMNSAYYKAKVPMYWEQLHNGEHSIWPFFSIRNHIRYLCDVYNVQAICAYNAKFDVNALNKTSARLGDDEPFFPDLPVWDIWNMACQTILQKRSFQQMALDNEWESEAGNVRTSAEVAYRYLSGMADFEEQHTGLADVLIETQIFAKCMACRCEMVKEIVCNPWRIPQPPYKAYKMSR